MRTYERLYNGVLPAAVFLGAVALYFHRAFPTVGWGDSADFVLTSYFLGVAHPTGYPLTTMTGKLFTMLPVGDVAFAVNLMSALAAAVSVALIYILVRRWSGSAAAALLGAVVAQLSNFTFFPALSAEAYTFNLMLCLFLTIAFFSANERLGRNDFAVIALLGGIALGNHGTAVFPAAVFALFTLFAGLKRGAGSVAAGIFAGLAAITLYACLPLFSARTDLFDWQQVERISVWPSFLTGEDFRKLGGNFSFDGNRLFYSFKNVISSGRGISSATIVVFILAVFALPGRMFKFACVVCAAFIAVFAATYPTPEVMEFSIFIPAIIVVFISAAIGKIISLPKQALVRGILSAFVILVSICVAAAILRSLPFHPSKDRLPPKDVSDEYLNSLGRDELFFIDHVEMDTGAATLYYQAVMNNRMDVFIFHRQFLAFPWYMDYMKARAAARGYSIRAFDSGDIEKLKFEVTPEERFRISQGDLSLYNEVDVQTRVLVDRNVEIIPISIAPPMRFIESVTSRGLFIGPCRGRFLIETSADKKRASRKCGAGWPIPNSNSSVDYSGHSGSSLLDKTSIEDMIDPDRATSTRRFWRRDPSKLLDITAPKKRKQ